MEKEQKFEPIVSVEMVKSMINSYISLLERSKPDFIKRMKVKFPDLTEDNLGSLSELGFAPAIDALKTLIGAFDMAVAAAISSQDSNKEEEEKSE